MQHRDRGSHCGAVYLSSSVQSSVVIFSHLESCAQVNQDTADVLQLLAQMCSNVVGGNRVSELEDTDGLSYCTAFEYVHDQRRAFFKGTQPAMFLPFGNETCNKPYGSLWLRNSGR